jgi:hypothetical protein
VAGVPVEEHDRGARQQRAHEEVPHHPARGGEPEQAVAGARVGVQGELLEVLEQDPALAVDDRLRQPSGPAGVQDPQRVVERQWSELERPVGQEAFLPARAVQVAQAHEPAADPGVDLGDHLPPVEVPAAVAVAVHGEQDLRLDLGEAVDHRAGAELGRRAGPHRAQGRRGQERRHGLGQVRQVRADAIALPHAELLQPCPDPGDLRAQLPHGPGPGPRDSDRCWIASASSSFPGPVRTCSA